MNIETLQEIKTASSELIKGRKKLDKLTLAYFAKLHKGETTRAQTTTYNANKSDIIENIIIPNEELLKNVLK